ncbi:MAG: CDF family Co(II)/Ni(II) efflux transporter DmeF [Caulobacterales bacterium]
MTDMPLAAHGGHSHVFLGDAHERNERRAWFVIVLCGVMMIVEIVGGLLFGSIALVADGLHMSTHAGALLLAALAYTFARRYAADPRFTFGTGKLGDLAGFTSAVVLAMIALLIGYEAVSRLFAPVPIHFAEAIPIAGLGLLVNLASAWLLSGGHDHGHGHGHGHEHDHHGDESQVLSFEAGALRLEIFEDAVPPRFRAHAGWTPTEPIEVETIRPDGSRQTFGMARLGGFLESLDEIPEPHAFTAVVRVGQGAGAQSRSAVFEEHDHGAAHGHHRDNNMRAAVIHVMADAAVSVLVIVGLLLARLFGWMWMDPLAGIVGACVIASWSYGLIRDTGAILLDMNPDQRLAQRMREAIESGGDRVADLHLWRLGPGHLGAIVAVSTVEPRDSDFYKDRLAGFPSLSHLTVEVVATGRG